MKLPVITHTHHPSLNKAPLAAMCLQVRKQPHACPFQHLLTVHKPTVQNLSVHNDSSRSVTQDTFTHRKLEQHREKRQHKGVLSKIVSSLVSETFACIISDQNQTLKQKARIATIRTQICEKRKTHIHT
uniref:Uncharacterized protein n=1 Tax=Rhipicephalus appendiculatus TaxID=34631 RepID=A0A131YEP6_RHIAP